MMSLWLLTATLCVAAGVRGCGLPAEWRPLSDACRAELAEVIVYAKVLAIHHRAPPQHQHHHQQHQHHQHPQHQHPQHQHHGSIHNSLPFSDPYGYGSEGAEEGLLYTAEVELVCDQAWGSMLEVPAGSRLNVTGLGYLSCHSHTVVHNESYIFFLRMDENYNILPHGVNFQDAIFPDTPDNKRVFASLFQFSNCSSSLLHPQHHPHHPHHLHLPGPDWLQQEDTRLLCSSVQEALFEEEEQGRRLTERLAAAERRNRQLRERVRRAKRSLRAARREARDLLERLAAVATTTTTTTTATTRGAGGGGGGRRRAGQHHVNDIVAQDEAPPPRRRQGRRRTPL